MSASVIVLLTIFW